MKTTPRADATTADAGPPVSGPFDDLRVIDIATLFAGPSAATILADFGADVLKIEHPTRPDGARTHGKSKDGKGLWWLMLGRNKRTATLDLSRPQGKEVFLRLVRDADIVVENFRPGTLEKWGLDYETLAAANPGLILVRVTGFGQTGPMARRPAYGTLAEAMSGFAFSTGQPDGPPTLPPLALADNIAGLAATIAILTALHSRARTGRGQVVDLAIIEPILTMLGPQLLAYDQLGYITQRAGNRSENNAPRNTYLTRDGRWVAISSSSTSIAERVMRLVGRADLAEQPWFGSGVERAQRADEIDGAVAGWIAERDMDEVIAEFERAEAAIAPVYDMSQVIADPQLNHIGTIATVEDPDLGDVRMQNVLFRLSETPGAIRHTGRGHGADTDDVLGEAGYGPDEIAALRAAGAV
ncbi:CaiB/BaiF CoA transferase family protein [Microbacterium gallinarum]|uniref:CoA transferase n=1 Tax=Microbacterium gallinarum TaxID=2762209 RepID=A0ABR8X0E8_9MICO|nr:CoA transferase [Microbacterium gallinarum]MBD8022743.1 CoA transferase [Microbacterium gallinarum]